VRPAAHLLSFASPKESRQSSRSGTPLTSQSEVMWWPKGDPAGCDPPLRCGRPAPRRCRGALQNSLRASRCARTAAASQMTKQLLPRAAQLPPRHRHVAGASRRDPPERAIASLGPRKKIEEGQGCAAALLTPVPRVPSVCAEERSGWRIRARDCLSEASSSETPPAASTAGCPQRSGGTQTVGSPSLWLLSLGETRESDCAAGRTSRPLHLNPEQAQKQPRIFRRPPQAKKVKKAPPSPSSAPPAPVQPS